MPAEHFHRVTCDKIDIPENWLLDYQQSLQKSATLVGQIDCCVALGLFCHRSHWIGHDHLIIRFHSVVMVQNKILGRTLNYLIADPSGDSSFNQIAEDKGKETCGDDEGHSGRLI